MTSPFTEEEGQLRKLLKEGCPHCGSKKAFNIEKGRSWLVEFDHDLPLDEIPRDEWTEITCDECLNIIH